MVINHFKLVRYIGGEGYITPIKAIMYPLWTYSMEPGYHYRNYRL